jgi:Chaperone for flagella basal body P-ring formation
MKRLAMITMLMSGALAVTPLRLSAGQACRQLAVEASVEAGPGELTLGDVLSPGACPQLRAAAVRVSLGAAPLPGSVRMLDGREIRRRIENLEGEIESSMAGTEKNWGMAIPERIVVKRRGATKSCAEIARFVAGAAAAGDLANAPSRWREDLECAGARGVPGDAPLELTKTGWSAALERREFALRCARPRDCVPFLVWVHEPKAAVGAASQSLQASGASSSRTFASGRERLVAPGQTASLTWDQAGIRVVLPVTCLDAGGLGQFVRVRLKNAARILRAEVVGQGTLRANL